MNFKNNLKNKKHGFKKNGNVKKFAHLLTIFE